MIALLHAAGIRWRGVITAVALAVMTVLTAFTLTVLSGWLITRAWEMPPILDLSVAITAVRALGVSKAVFRYADRVVSHRISLAAEARLRVRQFDAVTSHGAMVSATRLGEDIKKVTESFARAIVPILSAMVMSVIAMALAGWLLPQAALLLAVAMVFSGVVAPWLALRSARDGSQVRTSRAVIEALDRAMVHRAEYMLAGKNADLEHAVSSASRAREQALTAAERPTAWAQGIATAAQGFAVVGIVWLAVSMYSGEATWMGMLIFVPLVAFESHTALPAAAVDFCEARNVARELSYATKISTYSPHQKDGVVVRNLRCVYGDRVWNFSVPRGGSVVLKGASGSGKTTLLRTLAGELSPRSGTVSVDGTVSLHTEDEWIFATTVRENLLLACPHATDTELHTVCAAVGLTLPLDLMLPTGADALSSGQRRRLVLARALLTSASTLLLDEPTEHIEQRDAARIMEMLTSGHLPGTLPTRTVIIVTHAPGLDSAE